MVTIKRRIFVTFFALCLFIICTLPVSAAEPVIPKTKFSYKGTDVQSSIESVYRTDHAFFKDEADILSSESEKLLWEKLQAVSDYLNINIAFFIGGNYRTDDETIAFTMNGTSALFGSNSDTIFVYIDFEGYSPAYDYIRTFNKADDIFSEIKRNKILNTMYQKLPKSTEPVYEKDVKEAISDGIDEIKSQGYVNTVQPSAQPSAPNRADAPAPDAGTETNNGGDDFFSKLPAYLIIIVIIIAILIVFWVISSLIYSVKRRFTGSYGNNYYNSGSYYGSHNSYYGGRSYHHDHYHRRPPRNRPPRDYDPPRSSRPSHSSSSSSGSSKNDTPHSSGSGHYR